MASPSFSHKPIISNEEYQENDSESDDESLDVSFSNKFDESLSEFSLIDEEFYTDEGPPIEDEKVDLDKKLENLIPQHNEDNIFNEIKEYIIKRRSASRSENSVADSDSIPHVKTSSHFSSIPFGIIPKASYEHGNMCSDIMGVTYNERMRQFIILDAKGMTTWKRDAVERRVNRVLQYPKYEYRLITHLVYAKKYNCYFGLGRDFSLKVFNRDFVETCSVSADLRSVIFMIFNPVKEELITGGVGGTKIWQFHQQAGKAFGSLKPLANYGLSMKYELPNVGGGWVKRVELDYHLEHLYCCSDTGLHVYDLEGKELLKYERAHTMTITGCRFSKSANFLVTSSVDTEVKVWSLLGGLVHTFRGHSRAVTNLMLHPFTPSIIVTCSLDGSIRMWSLDTMECLYSLVVSVDGVLWMGATDDNLLYLCTPRTLTLWNINYYLQFWSLVRSSVTHMSLCGSKNKTTRLMVMSEDSSVRLMARGNRKNLSIVLPPPCVSPLDKVISVSYSRDQNTMYLLINPHEIWVYTTRTDPSCRIAIWIVSELQTNIKSHAGQEPVDHVAPVRFTFNKQPISHRATETGNGTQPVANCCCLAVLNSAVKVWTVQGSQYTDQDSFLLLGLEDGRILFMDLVMKGQKYLEFKTGKDPVLEMTQDVAHNSLNTLYRLKGLMLVQIWGLPDLELKHEVYAAPDLTAYKRLDNYIFTGYTSGCVIFHHLQKVVDTGLHKARMLPPVEEILEIHHKPEHSAPVISIDVCVSLKLFCSCSNDGALKIWNEDQAVLTEIFLDTSLSSVCFLNNLGDIVVGFQKHIFFIDHSKVCPNLNVPESDVDSFDKESVIYEDPAVMFEGIIPYPDPITLENYLVPFDIEFSKDFLEGKIKNKPEPELEITQIESRASMAPTEIYFSPEATPRRRLSLIDLTINSGVSKDDLLTYMEKTMEHLSEKEKKDRRQLLFEHKREKESKTSALRRKLLLRFKRANQPNQKEPEDKDDSAGNKKEKDNIKFSFPKFGKSPGPTPEPSAPATPDIPPEPESIQFGHDRNESAFMVSSEPDRFQHNGQNIDEDEISKFLKAGKEPKSVPVSKTEPAAPRKKFGLTGISIDAQTLMKDAQKALAKSQTNTNQSGRVVELSNTKKVEPESNTVELKELQLNVSGETSLEKADDGEADEVFDRDTSLTPEAEDEASFQEDHQSTAPHGGSGEGSEFTVKLAVPDLPFIPIAEKPPAAPKLSAAEAKAALMSKLNKRTTLDFSGIKKTPKDKDDEQVQFEEDGEVQKKSMINVLEQQEQNDLGKYEMNQISNVVISSEPISHSDFTSKEKVLSFQVTKGRESNIPAAERTESVSLLETSDIHKEKSFRAFESPEPSIIQPQSHDNMKTFYMPSVELSLTPEPALDNFQEEEFLTRYMSTPTMDSFIDQSQNSGWTEEKLNYIKNLESNDQHNIDVQIRINDQEIKDLRMKSAHQMHADNLLTDSEMYEAWARPQTSVEMMKHRKGEDIYGGSRNALEFKTHAKSPVMQFQKELELITKLPGSRKDLQAAFEHAMMRYQNMARAGLVSGKLYKNDDQDFAENWHERQIERHMLLRMQRELRILNVHKKRQLLEQIKVERTKQHILTGMFALQ
ncbi:hypothetical protein Btru_066529 [Bulinus truncatus]|nr:hypothetical protein Btru_066529 [Bulinus truncatus]